MAIVNQITDWLRSGGMIRVQQWGMKGGLAIIDQGLFSSSNFLMNIVLVRWLAPSSYGAFSIAFAVFLFFSGLYNALILEPMSVFATSKYYDKLKSYISSQFVLHLILSVLIGGAAILAGGLLLYFHLISALISDGIIGMGLFLPLILSMWVVRRSCYILEKPFFALVSSLTYFTFLLVGLLISRARFTESTPLMWFGVMGIASLMGSCAATGLMYSGVPSHRPSKIQLRALIAEQWMFGKWILLATFFYFIGSQIQVFFIAYMLNLGSAGAFRSLQIMILPLLQVLTAMTTLVFPSIVSGFGRGEYDLVRRKSLLITLAVFSASVANELLLLAGSSWIVRELYGGKYAAYVWLLPVIGLVPVINSLVLGFSLILRSLQRPHFYLIDKVLVATVGSMSAFFFIRYWDVAGAVFSLIAVELIGLTTHAWLYWRWFVPLNKAAQGAI